MSEFTRHKRAKLQLRPPRLLVNIKGARDSLVLHRKYLPRLQFEHSAQALNDPRVGFWNRSEPYCVPFTAVVQFCAHRLQQAA